MKQAGCVFGRWLQRGIILAATAVVATACNLTKHVQQGKYLVNKVRIEVTDNQSLNKKELRNYVRQLPNHEILGGAKFQLAFYNLSGNDTTRWYNRWIRRLGQPPVI